jgi:hypothetical protein
MSVRSPLARRLVGRVGHTDGNALVKLGRVCRSRRSSPAGASAPARHLDEAQETTKPMRAPPFRRDIRSLGRPAWPQSKWPFYIPISHLVQTSCAAIAPAIHLPLPQNSMENTALNAVHYSLCC